MSRSTLLKKLKRLRSNNYEKNQKLKKFFCTAGITAMVLAIGVTSASAGVPVTVDIMNSDKYQRTTNIYGTWKYINDKTQNSKVSQGIMSAYIQYYNSGWQDGHDPVHISKGGKARYTESFKFSSSKTWSLAIGPKTGGQRITGTGYLYHK